MKLRWLLVLSLVIAGTLSVCSPDLSAQDEKAAAHVARLLDVGWGTTTSFRTAADSQSEALFSAAGRQPSTLYAAALVQIKQRRYAAGVTIEPCETDRPIGFAVPRALVCARIAASPTEHSPKPEHARGSALRAAVTAFACS